VLSTSYYFHERLFVVPKNSSATTFKRPRLSAVYF
jgi:hypothetical protein